MAEITITITAYEHDLRYVASDRHRQHCIATERRVFDAIAAALPKPRIQMKPGMVLRHRASGQAIGFGPVLFPVVSRDGLDPDEWEVLLDAEDGAT